MSLSLLAEKFVIKFQLNCFDTTHAFQNHIIISYFKIPDIIDIQVEEDEPDEEVKVEEKMETPSSPVIARPSSLTANIGRPKSMMSPGSMGMGPMPMFDVSQVKLRKTKVSDTKQCSLPDNPSNKPSWMDELKKNQVNNRRSLGTFLEKQAPKQR